MDIAVWDERYRTGQFEGAGPEPLVVETAARLKPGRALDLACGAGRNAAWLAARGWRVTAVDGSPAAIEILRRRAPGVDARVADLEMHQFVIEPGAWELILVCNYLQRDLFEPVKRGLAPDGVAVAMVLLAQPGEESSPFRARPGELAGCFQGLRILYSREGEGRAAVVAQAPGEPRPTTSAPTLRL